MKHLNWLLCLVLVAALSGCSSDKTEDESGDGAGSGDSAAASYDTPQAAYEAAKTAAANEDAKKFFGCLTKESQNQMTAMMVMSGMMMQGMAEMAEGDEKASMESIKTVLEKHGITEEKMEGMDITAGPPDFSEIIDNQPAFISDMMDAMKAAGDSDSPIKMFGSSSLKDVSIDGDSASGTLVIEGQEEPIAFRKVDGSWKLHMEE